MATMNTKIPKNWKLINLERECSFERGMETGADAYNSEGVGDRFIRVVDVTESRNNPVFVDGVHTTKRVKSSDILLTLDGTVGAIIKGLEGIYSTGVRKVAFREAVNSNRLLYYILQSTNVQHTIDVYASGSTIKHASSAIPHLVTVVPNQLKEQNKIADILELIDQTIEKTDALIKKYEHIRAGMMQDLFRYGIDEKGRVRSERTCRFRISPLGKIPREWEVKKLSDVCSIRSGSTPSRSVFSYWSGNYPWVSAKDMKIFELWDSQEHITEKAIRAGYQIIPAGAILIVTRGMILTHTFPVGIAMRNLSFNQDLKALICNEMINYKFFAYWMIAHSGNFLKLATSATHGTKKLDTADIENCLIALPPHHEQMTIATKLAACDASLSSENIMIYKLQTTKDGLMTDLLSGAVRSDHLVEK